jgi:membrane fusion protein (multidrug efflux system)
MSLSTKLAVLALAGVATVGCTQQGDAQEIEFRVPVFARDVETGAVEDRIVATGTLRAPEGAVLRSETEGALIVAKNAAGRRLSEGDRVRAGELITELTGAEVRLAARTEATRQRYETTKRDYESKKQLYESGLLSEAEFLQVEATLADARLELEFSERTEERSRLITPIDGVILWLARDDQRLPIADGQAIEANMIVAQIAPTAELVAEVDLVGVDLARARVGLPARVRHHAWDDRTFEGTLERLAPALDPVTRTLRADVRVANGDGLLRPGMFVEVTIVAARREGVPVVPREAVTERGGSKVVFVLDGQRVSRRDVVLGLGDDEIVEIKSGLEPGERIVVRGLETLTDGTRVRASGV